MGAVASAGKMTSNIGDNMMTTSTPCRQAGVDPDLWFSNDPRPAVALCRTCPLAAQCGLTALEEGIPYGVYGGLTVADRERWWSRHGGRPSTFEDRYRDLADALLHDRLSRERERTTAA